MMSSFRCVEINCFNRFRFLAEVSANLQKMDYFEQFKGHNSERKKGNSWGPSFVRPFWSAKYLNFGGESYEIRIFSHSIQKTYTLRKKKNQILLFLSSLEQIPKFSG